jgi:hypothetical protein
VSPGIQYSRDAELSGVLPSLAFFLGLEPIVTGLTFKKPTLIDSRQVVNELLADFLGIPLEYVHEGIREYEGTSDYEDAYNAGHAYTSYIINPNGQVINMDGKISAFSKEDIEDMRKSILEYLKFKIIDGMDKMVKHKNKSA